MEGGGDCIAGDGSGDGRIAVDGAGETDSERSDPGDADRLLQFFNHKSGVIRLPETIHNTLSSRHLRLVHNQSTCRSALLLQVWMLIQVGLSFVAKYLHLVLIETLVRAELQLGDTVLEVHVADGMSYVAAPVASFGPLERSSTALREARFRTEDGSLRGAEDSGLPGWDTPPTPLADGFWKEVGNQSMSVIQLAIL